MAATRALRHTFTARIVPIALGVPFYIVNIPAPVSRALGTGRVNVSGTINGAAFQSSLVPVKGGRHKLFINRRMRQAADLGVGDQVKVVLARDAAPVVEPIPDDLARALRDADALGPFERLSRSVKNEVIRWIDDAKTEPTRAKRIQRSVERGLAAREKEVDREVDRLRKARARE